MTNERSRGRPDSNIRTWSKEVQIGVRLRLDLDATALCTLFLSDTDNSTLIRRALEEFARNHGLESTKQEVQNAILRKAESFEAVGLVMTSSDYLSGKTPTEKLAEPQIQSTHKVPLLKKNTQSKKKKPVKNEETKRANDTTDIGGKEKATDLASFGQVLLKRYGIDDVY